MKKDYNFEDNVDNIDEKKWVDFVEKHPDGNIFQTPYFYKVYNQTKNYEPSLIVILGKKNEILGIQLSVIVKLYSNVLGSFTARSLIFGGPLVLNNNGDVLDLILSEYKQKMKNKALYSEFRNMWDWQDLKKIFFKNDVKYDDHLDILFDLKIGEEMLLKKMKRVRRKGINQAYKKGIEINEIDLNVESELEKAYSIIKTVYTRIKLPLHDIDYFRQTNKYLGNKLLAIALFIDEEMVAVRFALCFNGLVYDWYAGAKDEYLNYRPNDVLPWELMKWGVKKEYSTFDFGGAGKPGIPYGVRDHKMKFGGELVNHGRFEMVHKPILLSLAKFGFSIKRKFFN